MRRTHLVHIFSAFKAQFRQFNGFDATEMQLFVFALHCIATFEMP